MLSLFDFFFSIDGVTIVLELSRVLAALKDYSKCHKDQYWKLLKVGMIGR